MNFSIDNPVLTSLIIFGAFVGVPFLLRSRFPKQPSKDSDTSDASGAGPSTADTAPTPPRKETKQAGKTDRFAASPAKRKAGLFSWLAYGAVALAAVFWFSTEGMALLKIGWPLLRSAANGEQVMRGLGGPHSPSGASLAPEHADYGACTEPPKKGVLISKDEVTKIDTPLGCVVNLDLTTAEISTLDLSCTDLHGDEHEEWSDELCAKYEVLGIKLKKDAPTDSRKVNITFTGPNT